MVALGRTCETTMTFSAPRELLTRIVGYWQRGTGTYVHKDLIRHASGLERYTASALGALLTGSVKVTPYLSGQPWGVPRCLNPRSYPQMNCFDTVARSGGRPIKQAQL